jgi:glycosyltransferase involved in cell wall biosynthesis
VGGDWSGMDLTILVCNYNTPHLVSNLLKSIKKQCADLPNVVVMDTSEVWDESLNELEIPNFKARGFSHGEAVNLGFSKVKTRYVLLVDSDVIFLDDFKKPFERFKELSMTLMGKIVGDCGGKKLHPRIEPWYCFIDLFKLKQNKIQFFDKERSKKEGKEIVYDIGSTMYEDVVKANLLIGNVDLENRYFKHYGGMSWREQKYNPNDVDTDIDFGGTHPHKVLYDIAQQVKAVYLEETKILDEIDIKGVFKND